MAKAETGGAGDLGPVKQYSARTLLGDPATGHAREKRASSPRSAASASRDSTKEGPCRILLHRTEITGPTCFCFCHLRAPYERDCT
jgi:hypothetical protein